MKDAPTRPYRHETDVAGSIRQEDPHASLRTIAETLSVSLETVRTHMSAMGSTRVTFRWLPQALIYELISIDNAPAHNSKMTQNFFLTQPAEETPVSALLP
jgi:hypothetical protein